MSLSVGDQVGRYEILEHLGGGGMGVVYKARDLRLKRTVALKFLPPEWSRDPGARERFMREARAASALDHPNICTVYEVDETEEGRLFIAMAFCEGETLKKRIERGPLPIGEAVILAIQIAEGLQRAHEEGIVHRDIKPANVIVTERGEVRIVDFGLAKLAGEFGLTQAGATVGTPQYMSPEQARGEDIGPATDIWSLGVVLFELAAGVVPFRGESSDAVINSIRHDPPPRLCDLRPDGPPMLERIVGQTLEKEPAKRYASIEGMINDLRSLEVALSEGSEKTEILRADSSTRRRLVVAVPIAGIALLAVVALLLWQVRTTPSPAPADEGLKRIVVLPFENLGPPEDEYFAAGMTEEITSRLAAVSGLQVISRTSARAYAGTTKKIREIGQELDVGYVVEGTVRWNRGAAGLGRVRITPQLIRVADDSHLWSERYDRLLEDVFAIQSDIASQVIDRLQTTLLEPELRAIEARPTENMEAYQAYLLAVQYWWSGEREQNARMMVEVLERAVKLDPEFAPAHALLSQAHAQFYHYRYDFTDERREKARRSAERALELQPELAEAHLALGFYQYWCHRDYDAALAEIVIAEQGRPNDADVLTLKWAVFRRMARWQEALDTLERAAKLDPRGYLTLYEWGATLTAVRQYARAEERLNRAIAVAPDWPDAYYYAALNYLMWDGATDRARRLLLDVSTSEDPRLVYLTLLFHYYDRDFEALIAEIAELRDDVIPLQETYVPTELLRCVALAASGDRGRALPSCESAVSLLTGELELRPYDHRLYSALGHAHAILGHDVAAVTAAERAVEMWPVSKDAFDGTFPAIALAKVYARVGEYDRAIDQLEELLSIPCRISAPLLRLDPAWDPLRDHPRFQEILETYGSEE